MNSVGVNLLWLAPGLVGGSENYTLSLLRAIHELDPLDLELTLYGSQDLLNAHPDLGKRFEFVVAPRLSGRKLGRVFIEHTWLSRHTGGHQLMHYAGGVLPKGAPARSLVTILDLQPLDMPQNFGRMKRFWLGQMIPRSVDDAALIIVPSHFTANRLAELLQVPSGAVRVVPFGLPAAKIASTPTDVEPVILYPAIAYLHKRHCDLIDAFAKVRAVLKNTRLVLTGGDGPETGALKEQVGALGLVDAVEFTGRVTEDEMYDWYRRASVMAFPSEYEGFGLPPLEAMNANTPVIVSDAGSLPEVVGDAAIIVPVRNVDALADAIVDVLSNPDRRALLVAAGAERAATFTWQRAGEALISAYRDALV